MKKILLLILLFISVISYGQITTVHNSQVKITTIPNTALGIDTLVIWSSDQILRGVKYTDLVTKLSEDIGGSGGVTNLDYTASPTNGTVTSDTGTDATIPLVNITNAGLMTSTQRQNIIDNNAKVTNASHTGDVVGDSDLVIQVDAVDIPMISANGTPSATTFLRGDNEWATPAGSGNVSTFGTPVINDYARFTGATDIEGRSYAEARTDLGLVIGTNVQAYSSALDDVTGLNTGDQNLNDQFTISNPAGSYTTVAANKWMKGIVTDGDIILNDVGILPEYSINFLNNSGVDVDISLFAGQSVLNSQTMPQTLADGQYAFCEVVADNVWSVIVGGTATGGASTASDVSTVTTNFNNNLSTADTDVQKALETLDDLSMGTGNVSNFGTPLNDQLAVWTDATTIQGQSNLTYSGSMLTVLENQTITGTLAVNTDPTDDTMVGDRGYNNTLYNPIGTGTPDGTKFLRDDNVWTVPSGGGNVSNSGTPVAQQLAVWTDATTIEGEAELTYSGKYFIQKNTGAGAYFNVDRTDGNILSLISGTGGATYLNYDEASTLSFKPLPRATIEAGTVLGTSSLSLGTTGQVSFDGLSNAEITGDQSAVTLGFTNLTYEDALGNPGTDDFVLSSTIAGVRSWVANGSGVGTDLGYTASTRLLTSSSGTDVTLPLADGSNAGLLTSAEKTVIGNTTNTNSGNNAVNTLYSGLVTNANHSGDATGSTALTLATVNSNVGSFTNADITVNAKGLITAASSGSSGTGDVTASANLGDNFLIRGDGAVKGVQNSGISISDTDDVTGIKTIDIGDTGTTGTDGHIQVNNVGAVPSHATMTFVNDVFTFDSNTLDDEFEFLDPVNGVAPTERTHFTNMEYVDDVNSTTSSINYTTDIGNSGRYMTFTTATPTTITLSDDGTATVDNQFWFVNNTGSAMSWAYGASDVAIQGTLPDLEDGQTAWAVLTAVNTWSVSIDGGSGMSNLVDDGSPQLGGDIDFNGNQATDATGSLQGFDMSLSYTYRHWINDINNDQQDLWWTVSADTGTKARLSFGFESTDSNSEIGWDLLSDSLTGFNEFDLVDIWKMDFDGAIASNLYIDTGSKSTTSNLLIGEIGRVNFTTNTSAITITIPDTFSLGAGATFTIIQENTGGVTITSGGTSSINGTVGGSVTISGQYKAVQFIQRTGESDDWIAIGAY